MTRAKPRHNQAMLSSKGSTRRFYLPDALYDQLLQEAGSKDIAISRLLRQKLELLDKISFMVLKNNGEDRNGKRFKK